MAKADRSKDEIGWLKVIFSVLAAIDASLVAWVAQNYESSARTIVIAASGSIALITALIACVVISLYRCLKILEAL